MKRYLSSLIHESTGMNIKQFCSHVLGTQYPTFINRVKVGKIHIREYLIISKVTGHSLDTLIAKDPRYADLVVEAENVASNMPDVKSLSTPIESPKPNKESSFQYIDV